MRAKFISESLDEIYLQPLYEIGTASAKRYKYIKPLHKFKDLTSSPPINVTFKTESGLKYVVELKPLSRYLKVDFFIDDNGEAEYPETNRGELFKIMSTITSIIKDVIDLNPDLNGIRYDPKSKGGDGTFGSGDKGKSRDDLYLAFIKQHLNNFDIIKQGFTTFIKFINENYINSVEKILRQQLDIPTHKIKYFIDKFDYLAGSYAILSNYGIPLNQETLNIFIDLLSEKLSGSKDVEYEWSDKEYDNLMRLKTLPKFEK